MFALGGAEILLIGIVFTIVGAAVWGVIALAKRGNNQDDIRRQVEEEVQRRLEEERRKR